MTVEHSTIKFKNKPSHKGFIDLEGRRFNQLIVIGFAGCNKTNKKLWYAVCDCERITIVESGNLKNGHTKSCGCFAEKIREKHFLKHGETRHRNTVEFNAYSRAKGRCKNPKNPRFKNYGGRGIKFLFHNFEEFLKHIGRKPSPQHSLNRINNNGHYEKGNVEWALLKQQSRNKQSTKFLTINRETKSLQEWCEKYNANYRNVKRRIYEFGWCISCAFSLSVHQRCNHSQYSSG